MLFSPTTGVSLLLSVVVGGGGGSEIGSKLLVAAPSGDRQGRAAAVPSVRSTEKSATFLFFAGFGPSSDAAGGRLVVAVVTCRLACRLACRLPSRLVTAELGSHSM